MHFMNTELTRRALAMSMMAHEGQVDRAGEEYYSHPVRVAERMESEHEVVVALLHDVVEDTSITLSDIQKAFNRHVANDVDLLSKRDGERTADYFERVMQSETAMKVKLADLEDNMRLERYYQPSVADVWAAERYKVRYESLYGECPSAPWKYNSKRRVTRIWRRNDLIIKETPELLLELAKLRK